MRPFGKGRRRRPIESIISNDIEVSNVDITSSGLKENGPFPPSSPPLIQEEDETNFEGNELDLFEQDLVFASSTVSSVVYKGSPTPSFGFFSSPKPRFNDIGSRINLGGKDANGRNSVFISSTLSNKIFIGSTEELTTKPTLPQFEATTTKPVETSSAKTMFPSFPIRLAVLSNPLKHKDFVFEWRY
jgi:hypothetical protein